MPTRLGVFIVFDAFEFLAGVRFSRYIHSLCPDFGIEKCLETTTEPRAKASLAFLPQPLAGSTQCFMCAGLFTMFFCLHYLRTSEINVHRAKIYIRQRARAIIINSSFPGQLSPHEILISFFVSQVQLNINRSVWFVDFPVHQLLQ